MATIYPSLLAAAQHDLKKEIEQLNPYCDGYHIDIMDGKFVPNTSWDADTVNTISSLTARTLWVQLMVEKPMDWLEKLSLPSYSIVSVHLESEGDIHSLIEKIQKNNWRASIAINPTTSVERIFPVLEKIHQILVMSVEPGFSGQAFLPNSLKKIDAITGYRHTSGLPFTIGIDGGVSRENVGILAEKGVNDIVIGSAIFKHPDPIKALELFKKLAGNPNNADITHYHTVKKSNKKR